MTISRFPRAAPHIGIITILAGILVTGSLRSTEATATAPVTNTPPMQASETSDNKDTAAAAVTSLKVTVTLSPAVAKKATPDDLVFIFERATRSPRMTLAIECMQVKDLPATVVLDDTQSMSPLMKLSSAPEVVVVARVSKTGKADACEGDLEGMSMPVMIGTKAVSISINKVLTDQKGSVSPQGAH